MLESDHALAPIAHALDTSRWQNVDIERADLERLRNLDTNREDMPLDPRLYPTMLSFTYLYNTEGQFNEVEI